MMEGQLTCSDGLPLLLTPRRSLYSPKTSATCGSQWFPYSWYTSERGQLGWGAGPVGYAMHETNRDQFKHSCVLGPID